MNLLLKKKQINFYMVCFFMLLFDVCILHFPGLLKLFVLIVSICHSASIIS